MTNLSDETSFEDKKLELISLRIKNKYYNKNYVLDKVVSEIIKFNINKRK